MARGMGGKLLSRWKTDEIANISRTSDALSLHDPILGFSEEALPDSGDAFNGDDGESESCSAEENKRFWETQTQLLEATLYRTTSLETKVRLATRAALKEVKNLSTSCTCRIRDASGCRDCLRREIAIRLRNEGYNCSVCKSKWKTTQSIPAGEHKYLEVVEKQGSGKGDMRIIIEINFRAEFEMARVNEEYNQLIKRLPEVYVGKVERLKELIKIVCAAAKKCMKEKKMHLGPWRKHRYMECKWIGRCEHASPSPSPSPSLPPPLPVGCSSRGKKPGTSMLTCDLLDVMPVSTALRVL